MNVMYWLKSVCPYTAKPQPTLPSQPAKDCSKLAHNYIKCIHDDEKCCADLYQQYLKCSALSNTVVYNNKNY